MVPGRGPGAWGWLGPTGLVPILIASSLFRWLKLEVATISVLSCGDQGIFTSGPQGSPIPLDAARGTAVEMDRVVGPVRTAPAADIAANGMTDMSEHVCRLLSLARRRVLPTMTVTTERRGQRRRYSSHSSSAAPAHCRIVKDGDSRSSSSLPDFRDSPTQRWNDAHSHRRV